EQQAPRAFDDEFAGGSGAHVAGFAIEQADAEIVLDRLDAPAERGLAQMHRLRSMCEVQCVSEGHNVTEAAQIHGVAYFALNGC
ncbi:hypothetical protein IHV60_24865, partial [Escherichia coli]